MVLNSKNSKIKCFLILLVFCFGLSGFLHAESFTAFTGQINGNGINVRVDSTVGSELICTLARGELVEVVRESYDWYKIRLPKEAPAYIKKDLLECNNFSRNNLNPDFTAQSGKCLSATVIKDKVNIRLAPSESSWILGKVDKATVVNVVGEEKGWYKIHPVFQSYGWVNKKFINKEVVNFKQREVTEKNANVEQLANVMIIEGVVSPYGVVLWRKATHKLVTSENKLYFLKGDRRSLNSLNGRKVKVAGKLISPVSSKYPIIQIDMIEALN
jgi:SH3-like domain-containing protein